MIKKTFLAIISFVAFFCNAYDKNDLLSLKNDVKGHFEKLQKMLSFTGELPDWVKWTISNFGIKKEELDAIPRFKELLNASVEEFNAWFDAQTDDSTDALLKKVDQHPKLEDLIAWQNATYKNNSKSEGFTRLAESAHWKKKHSK